MVDPVIALRAALRRLALRVLARRRGEVRAIQDLRHLREVARFAGTFAVTLLLPAVALSYLALSSIRSEELSLDADLRGRATALSAQLSDELDGIFAGFESRTRERLRLGESPITDLEGLSPYLRAAYRFDAAGQLVAPFVLPDEQPQPPASAAWNDLATTARALEQRGAHAEAARTWAAAVRIATRPLSDAEARLGQARALVADGHEQEALDLLADLYADHASLRDRFGFRIGDLAALSRAQVSFARDPDVGATALQQLVDDLLAARWTVGAEGEAAVVREALRSLDGRGSTEWLGRARARLNEKYQQLVWSARVATELELVPNRMPEGQFRYPGARPDSPSLWAFYRDGEDVYAWSFSVVALSTDLQLAAARLDQLDSDLRAELVPPGQAVDASALTSVGLGPKLPAYSLAVLPDDAAALVDQKRRRRTTRIAIVLIAVFMVSVGVVNAAQVISREVENARIKADFAANVSHELRSPITQIRLKGEALQLGLVDEGEDMEQHFDAIVHEAERLSRLVDNVLDFAAIERGAKTYHLRADDLLSVVWTLCETHRGTIEERGLRIELDLPDDLPPVWFDREAIGQVITNLLSNASKYGADGEWVGVSVRVVGEEVEVAVADRGMGIPANEVEHVFDEFFRSTDPAVRRRKGTGIGLAIVRYIVEAHRGTIRVASRRNEGTTFTFTLPTTPPEGAGA
jgi:signal transduction histidine kinase